MIIPLNLMAGKVVLGVGAWRFEIGVYQWLIITRNNRVDVADVHTLASREWVLHLVSRE